MMRRKIQFEFRNPGSRGTCPCQCHWMFALTGDDTADDSTNNLHSDRGHRNGNRKIQTCKCKCITNRRYKNKAKYPNALLLSYWCWSKSIPLPLSFLSILKKYKYKYMEVTNTTHTKRNKKKHKCKGGIQAHYWWNRHFQLCTFLKMLIKMIKQI